MSQEYSRAGLEWLPRTETSSTIKDQFARSQVEVPEAKPAAQFALFDPEIAEAFSAEWDALAKRLRSQELSFARELRMALPDWRLPSGDLGAGFINLATKASKRFEHSTLLTINRLLVVQLALRLPQTLPGRNVPSEIMALYPPAARQLVTYLQAASDQQYHYPHDSFVKDLRFASGLSVPGGAQDVDLRSTIGYRASARLLIRNPSGRNIRRLFKYRQLAPWFRIHTDSRYLHDFNEPGWDACYLRIAALLKTHPEVLGMAGTSWFYDPQLESVSPRLGYLRLRPVERGAIVVRNRTSSFDIQSATATSESRRRLYEAGKFIPVSHTILWPREELLAWAQSETSKAP
jgi:hypothetical protein